MLEDGLFDMILAPAANVAAWAQETILAEDGPLHNPDHTHLLDADIGFLWASSAFAKRGRTVIGQAEPVMIRAGGWQKARQEQQLREWFGRVPDFLITLAADYCAQCSDTEFCALVEHELYHIGQEQDEFGAPKFTKDGMPKLVLRGHDVEEFVGVVRRYGASAQVAQMIEAAERPAEVSGASIAHACGTCLMAAA
ncbi:putative metallopeptidase [uncultured Castellaniella sp.]|uniref:putative metallopeptidase n=1 Tax=uncultured Castellaniella sp. TaxID=647907 RepID=UPI0026142962|nr:putative metallopeptidase [uncultured Castellaniella sp.]